MEIISVPMTLVEDKKVIWRWGVAEWLNGEEDREVLVGFIGNRWPETPVGFKEGVMIRCDAGSWEDRVDSHQIDDFISWGGLPCVGLWIGHMDIGCRMFLEG